MLDSASAQMLLMKCTGDEIWDEDLCRQEGIPNSWIEELAENFESGFDTNRNSIYVENKLVNQYRGVLDLHLAYKLAEFIGIDWKRATVSSLSRRAEVEAIKAELDEI